MSERAQASFTERQRQAIEGTQPLIALSAGAGSGKTTVLVERFLSLIDRGVPPSNILAVTFTERAAAEMKERIVRRFEERGDDENRRRAEAAYISTIHGLCARLLRENPLAARLDPSFRVMDSLTRGMFLDEQLFALYEDDWFREHVERLPKAFDSDEPSLFVLIRDAALKPREFGTDAPEEANFDVERHVDVAMARLDEYCAREWGQARERLLAAAGTIAGMGVNGAKSQERHRELCDLLQQLASNREIDPAWAEAFCGTTAFTGGASKDPDIAEVRTLFSGTNGVRAVFKRYGDFGRGTEEWLQREVIAPLKVGIYARARRLRDEYDAFKRERGLLDFEDLQAGALALLDDPVVQREYSDRFQHLLLDEAQDTSPVQVKILDRLRDGRNDLFAVGDVKQAVYGFRGAEVRTFRELYRTAGDGRMSLVENFRSRDEIIGWVNAVGGHLWADGSIEFEELTAKYDYPRVEAGPRVEIRWFAGTETDGKKESREEVRIREGADLARWIREAVEGTSERGPIEVLDAATRQMRPARYGDIAILTKTRTPFPVYGQCLSGEGVPFVKDGGRGFFQGLEIADVLNALRVVLHPWDDPALLAVLHSPMFGWSDADLVRLRQAAGEKALWKALKAGFRPQEERSVAEALEILSELRAQRSLLPPCELIGLLLSRTHYRAALLQTAKGRAQVANLEKLVEFARASAELDGPSLRRFAERATLAERHMSDESDAALASSDDDVVILSTIHGAKGLEWPIVVLPALETEFVRSQITSRYSAPDGLLLVEPKDGTGDTLRPENHRALRQQIIEREEAEARRLYYVAMTRAREYLVMSGQAGYSQKPQDERFTKPIEWLASRLGITEHEQGSRSHEFGEAPVHLRFLTPEDAPVARAVDCESALHQARRSVERGEVVGWGGADDERVSETAAAIVRRILPVEPDPNPSRALRATTVTRLTYFYRCPLVYYYDLVLQVEEHPRSRGKVLEAGESRLTAAELGTRVHAMLERADFAADPVAESARLTQGERDLAEADRQKVERLLGNVLRDPLMDRVRSAARVEREYPFYLDVNGTTLEGVIDLLFVDEDDRGVVLDYKSNDLSAPDRVNVLTEHYRPQIELYALAAHKAGAVEPKEAILYFLNQPVARTHALTSERLEQVEETASDALVQIGRGDWSTEPGEKCRRCGYRKRGFCEVGRAWTG